MDTITTTHPKLIINKHFKAIDSSFNRYRKAPVILPIDF